jgi:hypothetical protein
MALALLLLAACGTTHQARNVEGMGFLGDYSMLEEGSGDDPLLMYKNPDADFTVYDKVLFEPPTLWRPADSELGDLDEEDAKLLCKYLYVHVKQQLEKNWKLAKEPGPGVIRLQLAITEASDSTAALDMVTMVVPVGIAISAGKRLATGTATFVGAASLEGKITDSESGELLFAAVDKRVGSKSVDGLFSSWDDVKEAYDYWAQHIRMRIEAMQKGSPE